jgi:hypothetical protein
LLSIGEAGAELPDLEVANGERKYIAMIAAVCIATIWLLEIFGSHALPMSKQSALQGAILFSLPYLLLLGILKTPFDRIIFVAIISFGLLGIVWFPFVGFVSWFISYHPGPVTLLCPLNAALAVLAVRMWPRDPLRFRSLLWAILWSIPIGYYFFFSMLVWLQEKSLYVSPIV